MFENRQQAGEALAAQVVQLELERPVVLALPRGGVPVALPVARALNAPLDLILVRKIGVPGQPELAAGALVEGPPEEIVWNRGVMEGMRLTPADLESAVLRERARIGERREAWLKGRTPVDLEGRSAVLVDDGIATGATVRAALKALRSREPKEVVLAVPVAAADTAREMEQLADRVICLERPARFGSVGFHYRDFGQVADEDVAAMLTE